MVSNFVQKSHYYFYKSVLFTEKRPRKPETGIKDGFEETEHEFPFGIFRPEKLDYLFKYFVASEKFSQERTKKSWTFQLNFPEACCKW